ncbi:MAG: ABC transporter permease [Gemmatimonadota bacterium]|nr:MAG: ABC transporter permease [Gemmatimonadota bacterium]
MGYIFKEALRGLKQSGGTAALCVSSIGLSLLIFGLFLMVTVNVRETVQRLREKVEIEIFLKDTVTIEEAHTFLEKIRGQEGVMEAVYISKEAALRDAPIDSVYINAVGSNPLPASIRVRLMEDYRSSHGIARVVGNIENAPGIEEIASGSQWTQQLDRYILILSVATIIVGLIFGLASTLVISNTVQLTIFSRREIISIMQLIGAKDGFIRGPFVVEGTVAGVLGGMFSVGGLTALHWAAQQKLNLLLPLGPYTLLMLILLGGLLGALGSNYSVGKFLKTYRTP